MIIIKFGTGGWVVIRFSGTESLLRVFCEMPTRSAAAAVCEQIKDYFHI